MNNSRKEEPYEMNSCHRIKKYIKILVVDDDSNSTKLLKLVLESFGFEVVISTDGREGLELASSELPDVIILDVRMPSLNGWQVCERLKRSPKTKPIPVIFFTAYSQKTDFEKSKRLGAELFLNKPLDPEELIPKIWEILDKDNKYQSEGEKWE
jgi:putative two-component system response regulator